MNNWTFRRMGPAVRIPSAPPTSRGEPCDLCARRPRCPLASTHLSSSSPANEISISCAHGSNGDKYVDPQITAGTVAAAVFTSGISLALKAGRTVIQHNQLTLYQVTYDQYGDVQSVRVIPPNIGSEPTGAGGQ